MKDEKGSWAAWATSISLPRNTSRTGQVDSESGAGFSLLRGAGKLTREEFRSLSCSTTVLCTLQGLSVSTEPQGSLSARRWPLAGAENTSGTEQSQSAACSEPSLLLLSNSLPGLPLQCWAGR